MKTLLLTIMIVVAISFASQAIDYTKQTVNNRHAQIAMIDNLR